MVKISENVEVRIGVDIEDDKAISKFNSTLQSLQSIANSKALNLKIDVSKDTLKNLSKIESAVKEINKLSKNSQNALFSNSSKNPFSDYDRKRKEQIDKERMYAKMFNQIGKEETKKREQMYKQMFDSIDKEEKKKLQAQRQYNKEVGKLYSQSDKDMLNGYKRQLTEKNRALKESANRESQIIKQQQREYETLAKSLSSSMSKAQSQITKLGKSGFSYPTKIKSLQADLDRVISSVNWDKVDRLTFNKSIAEVRRLESEIKKATDITANNKKQAEIKLFSEKTFAQLDKFKKEFKNIGSLDHEIDRIKNSVKDLDNVAPDRLPHAMKSIRQEVKGLGDELKSISKGSGVKNFFGDLYDSMRTFTLGNMIGNGIEDGVRAIKDVVLNLDSAMTDMMKVAPSNFKGTSQELKQVAREANEVGKSVGQSTDKVIQGTAKALQTGAKTMKDAMEIARNSAMLANVGDLQQEQADTYIASIMSAYGGMDKALQPVQKRVQGMSKDYNNLTKFMDLANYAGNNFAISTGDVGEALQRSGAVLSEYGVTMEDSVAMIVGANESIQDSAKVGVSLKSMAINMAGVKASAKDGTLELNKTAKALKEIGGIDIYSDKKTGQVKDMMTILTELQAKYKDLSKDEQLALGEAIAGKHHANTFQALMGNWSKVIEMQKAYNDGMTIGSAEKENERYLNSVAGKINTLKQNLQQLVTNVVSSGFAKSILDIAINVTDGLVKISNSIDDLGLSIPTAIGLFTTLFQTIRSLGSDAGKVTNIFSALKRSISSFNSGTKTIEGARRAFRDGATDIGKNTVAITANDKAIRSLRSNSKSLRASKESLNSTLGRTSMSFKEVDRTSKATATGVTKSGKAFKVHASDATTLNKNLGRLKDSNVQLTTVVGSTEKVVSKTGRGFGNLTKGILKTSAGQMALNVGTSLLNGALISLVGAGIAGAIKGYQMMTTAQTRAREEAQNNINAIQEDISANNNKISVLEDVGRKYEDLAKKANKSAEETKQMGEYANQLAEILPELKIGEDENGNAIISMSGDVDYLISKLEQANKIKRDLLKAEVSEKADASMKLLSKGELFDSSALEKRNSIQARYDRQMIQLENQKQGILNQMRNAEGKDIKKYNDQLRALEAEKIKVTNQFTGEYLKAQQKVQEYANDIRQDSLNIAMSTAEFARLSQEGQQSVTDFIGLMDFSEVNADNIDQVNGSIQKMISACADGKLDIGEYKDKVVEIEKEFGKTGNIEEYNSQMEKLAREISNISGADYGVVLNMLKKMDDAYLKTGNGINDFLKTYDKSIKDVMDGNKLAEALKQQYDALQSAYDQIISGMSGDVEIDKKIALNFTTDENLPEELRDFIDTAINKQGKDPTKVLKVLQKIIPELQKGGDMDIAKVQKIIDDELGKNTFEVTPKMKMNGKAQVAQMDEFIAKVKEKYDEIPKDIETTIRANTTTSMQDVDTMMAMYKDFPEDVQTMIKTLGKEEAYQQMMSMQTAYDSIPKELMTYLKANGVNSISEATRIASIYDALPENVQTYLLANGSDALANAQTVDDVYQNIPDMVKTNVEMDVTQVTEKKSFIDMVIGGLGKKKGTAKADMDKSSFDKKASQIDEKIRGVTSKKPKITMGADISGVTKQTNTAQKQISNVKQKRKPKVDVDTSPTKPKIDNVQKNIDKIKQKSPVKIKADSSNAMSKIGNVKSGLRGIKDKTATITVTTKYVTLGTPTAHSKGATFSRAMPSVNQMKARPMTLGSESSTPQPNSPQTLGAPSSNNTVSTPSPLGAPSGRAVTNPTPIDTSKHSVLDTLVRSIELLQEMYNRINMVNGQLGILDERMKGAVGEEKIRFLQQQNDLFREQVQLQQELQNKLLDQQLWLKNELMWNGFTFSSDGNLINYEEKLLALEKEAERLQKIAEDSSKKMSDYKGEDEGYKNSLQANYDSDKKNADEYAKSVSNIKKMLEEYIKVTMTELPNAQKEWEKLNKQIKENEDALEKLQIRQTVFKFDNKLKELSYEYGKIADKLKLIDTRMENAYGTDKLALIEQQIDLLEEQRKKQDEIWMQYNHMVWEYKQILGKYGFEFDKDSNVANMDEILNKYESSEDLDKINSLLEEYLKLHQGMGDANKEWENLTAQIKKAYKEQLNITKEIETQITSIYKKQVEERKKLIDEELNKRLDALNKERKAYNDARAEADYNDNYSKQLEKVEELKKKIEIAERDDSLSGQKKLQDLLKQLKEEQEKLDKIVQDKIDKDVNDMFDKESNRLEQVANDAKDKLDKEFSDDKIRDLVSEALQTGVFKDIDGTMRNLQDVMLDFVDEYGDGLSAIGGIIKNELVANLEIAKNTMKEMSEIMSKLDLNKYTTSSNFTPQTFGMLQPFNNSGAKSVSIEVNKPLIEIKGNVDNSTMPLIREAINEAKEELLEEIVQKIR